MRECLCIELRTCTLSSFSHFTSFTPFFSLLSPHTTDKSKEDYSVWSLYLVFLAVTLPDLAFKPDSTFLPSFEGRLFTPSIPSLFLSLPSSSSFFHLSPPSLLFSPPSLLCSPPSLLSSPLLSSPLLSSPLLSSPLLSSPLLSSPLPLPLPSSRGRRELKMGGKRGKGGDEGINHCLLVQNVSSTVYLKKIT